MLLMSKKLIKKLENRYDQRQKERREKEEAERPLKERLLDIFSADRDPVTDFYCKPCKQDCQGTGYRQVCTVRRFAPTAWFLGICPKGHRMIRRITDKDSDPYYHLSPFVARQRLEMADDFLTPDDPRFRVLYPDKWEELMNADK